MAEKRRASKPKHDSKFIMLINGLKNKRRAAEKPAQMSTLLPWIEFYSSLVYRLGEDKGRIKVCRALRLSWHQQKERERGREREGGFWGEPKYKSVCLSRSHNRQANQSVLRHCAFNFFFLYVCDYNSFTTLTFYSLAAEGCSLEGGYTPAEYSHLGRFRS